METKMDILIAGGGLAGLTAAIHLLKSGFPVTLIEKNTYPQHKVCGEYISNEVVPYLEWLGLDISSLSPARINRFQLSTIAGKQLEAVLPLGGFGISRYVLDAFLYEHALERGCQFICETVTDISFAQEEFQVKLGNKQVLRAKIVIGAYGKRDALDQKLSRSFIQRKSPWLAIKAHYEGAFPDDLVALHNFDGGYCGVSKVENNRINICYLVDYASFKRYKSIPEHRMQVLYKNEHLRKLFENSRILFEDPLVISQISFERKTAVWNNILMIGDTAGLIHPLCGNGMAMAIHSAKICAESVIDYLEGRTISRHKMESNYQNLWELHFNKRLRAGKIISGILRKRQLSDKLLRILMKLPSLLRLLIKQTHGKPIMPT
ncbi:NAD(P)/FAD-dependent oxidoreductase [Pedobacter caeni]|uniref:Dehydrogenase (Flavoprotein) n=1 Tax=Pedobacter caeni TaxID=288992 RepID=A0A1M5G350_9SPHI|nr:NAD(P)/FAD-dependent oxidoreductase [Pedobacter caeni]SHF97862.1 Dehydrogenase (flavoprotein) [Pedobacter caeni]